MTVHETSEHNLDDLRDSVTHLDTYFGGEGSETQGLLGAS